MVLLPGTIPHSVEHVLALQIRLLAGTERRKEVSDFEEDPALIQPVAGVPDTSHYQNLLRNYSQVAEKWEIESKTGEAMVQPPFQADLSQGVREDGVHAEDDKGERPRLHLPDLDHPIERHQHHDDPAGAEE